VFLTPKTKTLKNIVSHKMNSVFPSSKTTQFMSPGTHTQGKPCQIEQSEQIGLLSELTAYSCAMLTKEAPFVS